MQNNVISRSYRLLNRILACNPFIRKKNRPSVNKHLKHDVVDIYLGETTFSPTKPSLTTNKRMEIIFMTTMTKNIGDYYCRNCITTGTYTNVELVSLCDYSIIHPDDFGYQCDHVLII